MRLLLLLLVFAGGLGISQAKIWGGSRTGEVPTHLLVAVDMSSAGERVYAREFLDKLSRKVNRFTRLSLDVLDHDTVRVVYSDAAKRGAVEEFIQKQFVAIPAGDEAIAASLNRIRRYAKDLRPGEHLVAVIVTEGTRKKDVIQKLTSLCRQIPNRGAVRVYVAGVAAPNRDPLSPVFHPIRGNSQVLGSSESEMSALIKKL